MASGSPIADAAKAPTSALLIGSCLAGPLYMCVSLMQAFKRPGFDLTKHPLSLLSTGNVGWIQVANFIATGVLLIAGAVGIRRALHSGPGRTWGPLLVGIFGLSFIGAGIFPPDPAAGFPPGTPADAAAISSSGMVHFTLGGVGFLAIIVGCFVFARRFGALRRRGWAIYSVIAGSVFLLAFAAISSAAGKSWGFIAFLIGVSLLWSWISLLSAHLRRSQH